MVYVIDRECIYICGNRVLSVHLPTVLIARSPRGSPRKPVKKLLHTITITNSINRKKSIQFGNGWFFHHHFPWISVVKPPFSASFPASTAATVQASNQASKVMSGQAKAPPDNQAKSSNGHGGLMASMT